MFKAVKSVHVCVCVCVSDLCGGRGGFRVGFGGVEGDGGCARLRSLITRGLRMCKGRLSSGWGGSIEASGCFRLL